MENLEQAKMNRNENVKTFIGLNTGVFTGNLPFTTLVTKFTLNNAACLLAASQAGGDNSGFSEQKLADKIVMGHLAAQFSGYAQVTLDDQGKLSISGQLHDAETFYTAPADAEAAARARAAYNVMNGNRGLLTGYVTDEDLEVLDAAITTFIDAEGSSGSVHESSPALTAAFKSALKITDKDVKNFIKLGKKYRTTNPTFFNGLNEVCKTPAVNVHHTNVDVSLHDKETGAAIANATASLSNSDKTGTSDINGILHIEHVHSGNPTLTIVCSGYKPFAMLTHIKSCHDNSFTILLEKE